MVPAPGGVGRKVTVPAGRMDVKYAASRNPRSWTSTRGAGREQKRETGSNSRAKIVIEKNLFCLPWNQALLGTHVNGKANFMALDWLTWVKEQIMKQ